MEPISTDVMALIEVIGQCVKIRVLRQGLMKGGVKNRYLGQFRAEYLSCGENSLDVVGVMEWGEGNAFLNSSANNSPP